MVSLDYHTCLQGDLKDNVKKAKLELRDAHKAQAEAKRARRGAMQHGVGPVTALDELDSAAIGAGSVGRFPNENSKLFN